MKRETCGTKAEVEPEVLRNLRDVLHLARTPRRSARLGLILGNASATHFRPKNPFWVQPEASICHLSRRFERLLRTRRWYRMVRSLALGRRDLLELERCR